MSSGVMVDRRQATTLRTACAAEVETAAASGSRPVEKTADSFGEAAGGACDDPATAAVAAEGATVSDVDPMAAIPSTGSAAGAQKQLTRAQTPKLRH